MKNIINQLFFLLFTVTVSLALVFKDNPFLVDYIFIIVNPAGEDLNCKMCAWCAKVCYRELKFQSINPHERTF